MAKAKRYSRKSGKSISKLFEEVFEDADDLKIKPGAQLAAQRLLQRINSAVVIKSLDDKALLRQHLVKKYS